MADAGQKRAFCPVGTFGLVLGGTQGLFRFLEPGDVDAKGVITLQPALALGAHDLGHLQNHRSAVGISFVMALDHHVLANTNTLDLLAVLLEALLADVLAHMVSDQGVGRQSEQVGHARIDIGVDEILVDHADISRESVHQRTLLAIPTAVG